ncbi:hypothetical protein GS429_18410 [Natronorubrum sp. JWXQ-INN-674]|uniref:Type I restriction enzyme R protein N-terminal domain-containing protein n=1 Tax=Natronorubrum halalkaliphilum TaxID=2691917 RepID=A0A6B0VTY0_9EURY|nr:hypothetical protein [Natronorubrum halalkaliphilum]MXV63999.1 hypothetical protein [Natronorubrum halalkaliphilum]
MSALDLHAFVRRSRALVDSAPPTSSRETRAWLVDPFLETLGWDVHADSCVTQTTVDDTQLEYVCSVDGVPALFVAVEPFSESLDKSRAVELLETMAWTGIDRAIYTNGRDYLLLAGTTDAERLACQLSSLSEHESTIAHYSRETVGRRLERHSREFVARQLATERSTLVDAIVAELTSVTEQGSTYETEFESAADRFIERLVATFADDGRGQPAAELETTSSSDVAVEFSEPTSVASDSDSEATGTRSVSYQSDSAAENRTQRDVQTPDPDEDTTATSTETDSSATDESGESGDTDVIDENEPDSEDDVSAGSVPADADVDIGTDAGTDQPNDHDADGDEYVVRFFNDRGSIGAIGHSSSARALVGTAEYLFDRGLSGVTVPWSPDDVDDDDDGVRAVLNDSPTHADGSPMADPQQLSNGLYLETGGETEVLAARVEALVSRAGLRAMLTGDWDAE